MSLKVLLIGGTSEGREVAAALTAAGFEVLVSTATAYGATLAEKDAAARSGLLDVDGMAALAAGAAAVVDASHPFAAAASETAQAAAADAGVPYVRFEREGTTADAEAIVCASAEDAAKAAVEAAGRGGTVLLTVGSRTLATYAAACRAAGVRCVARVLPVPESLEAAAAAGLRPADIVAMQGPASAELDAALLRHLGATVLVTKDSGVAGGVPEKVEAAREAGATVVVVSRPVAPSPDAVSTTAELLDRLRAESLDPRARVREKLGLVHIYTGDSKGKTTAGVGLAVRAAGAGLRVAFVQFVKGGRESSELKSLRLLGVHVVRPATASSGLMRGGITDADRAAAAVAVEAAREALSGSFDVVVLDEACVAARSGLVDAAEMAALVAGRAPHVEVVLTGRGAPPELLGIADYVTEMALVKHPFEQGTPAREGVEY